MLKKLIEIIVENVLLKNVKIIVTLASSETSDKCFAKIKAWVYC